MKPVITTVLLLYILTTFLQGAAGLDHAGLMGALRQTLEQTSQPADYSGYARQLYEEAAPEQTPEDGKGGGGA